MDNVFELPRGQARKAVILARVSERDQEEGHSIDAQKYRLTEYCRRKNLDVLQVFEITESSTRGDRKKFMAMIRFVKSQRDAIAIVADKVDRIQRSFREYPLLDDLIQNRATELHFFTEGYVIHKNSPSNLRTMWMMNVMMAQSYTDNLRDNVRRSQEHMIREGMLITVAPIGYLNYRDPVTQKATVILDPDRAQLVRRIFETFAAGGITLAEITEKANEWGLRNKTKRGNALGRSHIYLILTNPFYYGFMTIKGKIFPHRYTPLIEKALFDKCAAVLKGWNKKQFKYGDKEFVFRGILTCANAGRMVSALQKRKTYLGGGIGEWTYLRAWGRDGKAIYVREDEVLAQAQRALNALRVSPEALEGIKTYLREIEQSERAYVRRQITELEKEGRRVQDRQDGLMDLLMDGAVSRDEYDTRRAKLRERQLEIEAQTKAHRASDDGFKDSMLTILDVCARAAEFFAGSTVTEKRNILNFTLENLRLDGSRLCFDYRIPYRWFVNVGKVEKWSDWVDRLRTQPDQRAAIIAIKRAA